MIEKIGTEEGKYLSEYCRKVIKYLQEIKANNPDKSVSVAEIGVGVGATTVEILKELERGDKLYIFGFEDDVHELKSDLEKINPKKVEIIAKGNTHLVLDSYSWNLAKMALEMYDAGEEGIFDLAFLDGAHTFIHDSVSACLLKQLCKKDGIIIFDDYAWSFANCGNSEFMLANGKDKYTMEQMSTANIEMVCKIFMDTDPRFEKVGNQNSYRPAYRKIAD